MTKAFEEQVYAPKTLYSVTGVKAATMRAWKSRELTAPIEVYATGNRSLYSFVEMVLFATAKRLIDSKIEASEALRISGACTDEVRAMLTRKEHRDHWIVVEPSEGARFVGPIWAVSTAEQLVERFNVCPVSIVVNLGSIRREVESSLKSIEERS